MLDQFLAKIIAIHSPYRLDRLPQWVANKYWNPILEIDRWVFAKIEKADRQCLDEIQQKRLAKILWLAKNRTAYWKDKIAGDPHKYPVKILRAVPLFTKEILRSNNLNVFVNQEVAGWRKELISTSGTTTTPCFFYCDRLSFLRLEAEMKAIQGFKYNDNLARINLNFPPYRPLGKIFLFSLVTKLVENATNIELFLRENKPTHIFGQTTSILELASILDNRGVKYPFARVTVVGEHLNREDKKYLEKIFSCEVFNIYVSREAAGPIAYECQERDGWHINAISFVVEILDENNQAVPTEKEGNVVVTMLENEVMPFIRYKIGDRGYLVDKPCPCGRQSPRLFFKGRATQFFKLKNGNTHPLVSIVGLVRDFTPPVIQFQFEQQRIGEIIVRLATLENISEECITNILHAAKERFLDQLDVRIEINEKVPGKNILFINKLE